MNYLVEHAIKNIWCSPDQDSQCILKLARISRQEGHWNRAKIQMRYVNLPNQDDRFHIYQVGQVFSIILGLLPIQNEWVKMTECCQDTQLVANFYNDAGIRYPNSDVYYRYLDNNNLVFAFKENTKIFKSITQQNIYVRLYSNAFFNAVSTDSQTEIINEVFNINDLNGIINVQYRLAQLDLLPGKTQCFVNGYFVKEINPFTVKIGDIVELFYDSSIKRVIELPVKDLPVFDSIRDQKRKYIIHYNKSVVVNTIEYMDDVDFYLYKKLSPASSQGLYFHKNTKDSVRMLTHRDYSISLPNVHAINSNIPNSPDPELLTICLFIRKSGYDRSLTYEYNRLHELYKMNDKQILDAMSGIDSGFTNWKAAYLELSDYGNIMSNPTSNIDIGIIENGLGYNAIAKLIGDTPIFSQQSPNTSDPKFKVIELPYGLQNQSVIYEYDENRTLIKYSQHDVGSIFNCDERTTLTEVYSGILSNGLEEFHETNIPLDNKQSYRFYVSDIRNGVALNNWRDVTNTSKYAVINTNAVWLTDPTLIKTLVRSDKNIVTYELSLRLEDGLLKFPLKHTTTIDGVNGNRDLLIPPGEVDIFLNGKSLIRNLDYTIQFPIINIVNKEYLIDPEGSSQKITVRFRGLCDSEMKIDDIKETGYINFGMVSLNSYFNTRDDKVLRIVIDGKTYHKSELDFGENNSNTFIGRSLNGKPYSIYETTVPFRGLTVTNSFALKDAAMEVDQKLNDYLTLKLPEPKRNDLFSIQKRHTLYSAYFSKIMFDLINGVLVDQRIFYHYGDDVVQDICSAYKDLLLLDPCSDQNYPDDRFVIIHPTPFNYVINVNPYIYKFMDRVAAVMLKGRVDPTPFLRVFVM